MNQPSRQGYIWNDDGFSRDMVKTTNGKAPASEYSSTSKSNAWCRAQTVQIGENGKEKKKTIDDPTCHSGEGLECDRRLGR